MAPRPCYQGSRGEAHTLGKARLSVSSAASPGLCLSEPLLMHLPVVGQFASIT